LERRWAPPQPVVGRTAGGLTVARRGCATSDHCRGRHWRRTTAQCSRSLTRQDEGDRIVARLDGLEVETGGIRIDGRVRHGGKPSREVCTLTRSRCKAPPACPRAPATSVARGWHGQTALPLRPEQTMIPRRRCPLIGTAFPHWGWERSCTRVRSTARSGRSRCRRPGSTPRHRNRRARSRCPRRRNRLDCRCCHTPDSTYLLADSIDSARIRDHCYTPGPVGSRPGRVRSLYRPSLVGSIVRHSIDSLQDNIRVGRSRRGWRSMASRACSRGRSRSSWYPRRSSKRSTAAAYTSARLEHRRTARWSRCRRRSTCRSSPRRTGLRGWCR